MMLALMLKVATHGREIRGAHTEGSVAFLPCEIDAVLCYPAGRVRFENLNDLGDGYIRRQGDQDVNMVRGSAGPRTGIL
jgi:hypothetical protein